MKLAAVLKARSGATAACPAGLRGSTPWTRRSDVENEKAAAVEQQRGDEVGDPALLLACVDAGGFVERRLERAQQGREERPAAGEDARHVAAERADERRDERQIERDLRPADDGHVGQVLETFGTHEGVGEVGEEGRGDEAAEQVVEHRPQSLAQALA